ncbi:phage major capsid protein [Parvularcula marina]|uniref:phage major capsid protein n=1 Tax=Parvularcula marina TaxID=2292771 RepID=UPI003517D2AE
MELETKAHDGGDAATMQDILYTFEQFKQANDERLKGLEKRSADPLMTEKVDRIGEELSRQQAVLDRLAARSARPALDTAADTGSEAKSAFDTYMRTGAMTAPELKSIAAGDSSGGIIAPDETASLIDARLKDISPIRQIATVRQISGNSYRKPYPTTDFGAAWVGETGDRDETTTPTLMALDFPAMELYAMPAATQALLDDSVVDIGQWIADEVQTEFAVQESAAFVAGNSSSKPKGFLSYDQAADASRDADEIGTVASDGAAIIADDLIDLVYTLPQSYRQNGRFIMNRTVASSIRKLKDLEGNYIWSPGLAAGQPSTLLGFPVTESEDMPDVGTSTTPVAFGDFARGYLIVDRAGIQVLRDPYSAKPYVLFYTTKRVGGGVQDFSAIKLLSMSA